MKNLFKRICPIIMALVLLFSIATVNVTAIGGTSTIILSNKTPKVGETLTVTVRYNLDTEAQAVSGTLTFDPAVLKYVGANCTASNTDSTASFSTTGNSKTFYIKIELQVIAEGESAIKVIDAGCANNEEGTVEGATARITTKNATSNNEEQDLNANTKAALTSITVAAGQLTPAFNQNVTQYKVTVPYSQTDGVLSCESLDPNATITVEGDRKLKVGNNTRVIVVRASSGDIRRYTVVFNRLDENGNDITVPTSSDVKVTVNNKEYTIGQQDALLSPPAGFALSTTTYGEKEVTAYKNASGKIVLLYLLTEDGAGSFFLYENGKISDFHYISYGDNTYIVKDATESAPDGLYKTTYELNGKKVSCYMYTDAGLSDFVVFSAVSPDGNSGFYSYDVREKTLQRIVEFGGQTTSAPNKLTVNKSTKTVVVSLVSIFVVLGIVLIIALVIKSGKKSGKIMRNIFDTDEEEYEMEETSSDPDED